MRIPAFYHPDLDGDAVELSPAESHHLARVLRLKAGAAVRILNGKGTVGYGTIEDAHPKRSRIRMQRYESRPPAVPALHLYTAPPQTTDRLHWLVEKATELGCHSIHFLITERTVRHKVKLERLEKTAIAALKQSHNPFLPIIHAPLPMQQTAVQQPAFYGDTAGRGWLEAAPAAPQVLHWWIGPEGGFTPQEMEWLRAQAVAPIRLAPHTLRTETAAVAALTAMRACYS